MDINLIEEQPQNNYYAEPPKKKRIFLKFILPPLVGLILAGGGLGYYFYNQHKVIKPDTTAAIDDVQVLVAQVGKLIVLPDNETPTIATVSDPSKLANQAFFANAQKGDKVLIYPTSKKAILYRPSSNKIIEVAPINLGSPSPSPIPSSSPTPPASIR